MTLESTLKVALLLDAPRLLPNLRLFQRNVGAARFKSRVVKFAVAGQADLYGYWRGGRSLEIELKAAKGVMSPEQLGWEAWCHAWSVPHIVLRELAGETGESTVKRWCAELQAFESP